MSYISAKSSATQNKLGLPLLTPSKQTILPIFCGGNGNLQGFYTIASHTFSGSETTYALAEGNVPVTTYTLPDKVRDGNFGVQQFMAVVYPDNALLTRPWIGYSAWVDNNHTGWSRIFYMPVDTWTLRFNAGILYTNLTVNMAAQAYSAPSTSSPSVSNGTMRWVTSVQANSTQLECGFIDFNWVELFNAASGSPDPLSLSIVSNPAGGYMKATLVANQVIVGQGAVQFNTVRIIMLNPAPPGSYVFTFAVTDTQNNTTTCTLTLTVV